LLQSYWKLEQLVVSTGKSDWAHDVASVHGSLAHYLDATSSSSSRPPYVPAHLRTPPTDHIPGVHSTASAKKTTIVNGSHHPLSTDPNKDTVLILPDYKLAAEVGRSTEGAQAFWSDTLAEKGEGEHTHVIPYACVILLCKCPLPSSLPEPHQP
jgi:hypothetical protein